MIRPHPHSRSDAGMSLVELLIVSMLGVILVAGVSALFVSGWRAEAATRDRDAATGAANLIASSIQAGIRNSSAFTVTTVQISGETSDVLRASVLVDSAAWAWQCRAWALTPGGDLLYSTTIRPDGSYTGWTELAEVSSRQVHVAGTIAGHPFADRNPRLELGLTVTVGDSAVPVTAGALRQTLGEGAPTC